MLSEFQDEIIVAITVLTLIVIYIISKKRTSPSIQKKEDIKDTEQENISKKNLNKEKNEQLKTKEDTTNDIPYENLAGTQEGDFGETQECCEVKDSCIQSKKAIHKRAPIQHGKITKQNFSEFSGKRILIAEDNIINQKVIIGLLADSGMDIVVANDGQETLDILENDDDFLLILMDAHMPRIDGFEATRKIRQNKSYDHILIVALSGDTGIDDINKMKEAGMDEHLEKPLKIDTLYDLFYSYTGDDSQEYVEVIKTKTLDGHRGLEVCGGDDCFYKEILNEFITNYENSAQELSKLLDEHKLKEADKLLLDILGITANIGARQLNIIASDIKLQLTNTDDKKYLTLVDEYKVKLNTLIEDIKKYI